VRGLCIRHDQLASLRLVDDDNASKICATRVGRLLSVYEYDELAGKVWAWGGTAAYRCEGRVSQKFCLNV
jgi:hypothetical protein